MTQKNIELSILATGTLRAADLVSVGAQVSGQIKVMHVRLGQRIKKGQLLAEIDSMAQSNALRTAKANLRHIDAQLSSSEATLVQSKVALKRQQSLRDHDVSAQQELEAARLDHSIAHANVQMQLAQRDAAKISVDTARVNLSYARIEAPIDGEVVAVLAAQGQTVNANQTTPDLVIIADLDVIKIKVRISEADVIRVRPGQKAYFTILGDPGRRYETTLLAIEPAPDSIVAEGGRSSTSNNVGGNPVYYNGLMEVPNTDDRLRISMTAQVTIVLADAKQALAIPSSALLPGSGDGQGTVRMLNANGADVQRDVRIGLDDKNFVQILDGLQLGEEVVIAGSAPSIAPPIRARAPSGIR